MSKGNKDVKRGIVLYIDGKEVKRDLTDIKAEIRKLTKELDHMTIGSKEYNEQMTKIRHLNSIVRDHKGRLREVNDELGKSRLNVGKLVDGFNRFGGVIVSVIGFLTGFVLALRSIREERNKLEESQAGLKALTGLDDESISWLTDQAKTLSTTMTKEGLRVRQSAAEILDAFMLVGSAKPELLGDKEALKQVTEEAMRLQAAAKDITLNEAVDSLTLSLNQYGAAADQAGRFSNVLAAGSKEGAVNIASQAKSIRVAGVSAASANIPIEETVGLIETLGYRGIKDEVAGTGLKRFFLTLQTGADETNPKIVGLDQALEKLKNKKMDAGAIKKMFGEEGFNVASVILQNTEMVKDFTKAVTGTNVAYEQSATNSATAAAKLDQARNKMKLAAIELGERLNPAFAVSTNMMTNVIKFLPGLIDWFQKWGGIIVALLVPVAAYVGYLKLMAMYHTTVNILTKTATTLKILYAVATANVTGNLSGANKILTMFSGNLIKNATMLKIATAATYLFAAAKAVLTGNIKAARSAMAAFNAVCTKNVYVAIAAIVIALATAMYKLATRTTEAEKAALDYHKRLQTERTELQKLVDATNRAGEGTQRRKELIEEINSKYGKYLTNLLDEHSTLEDIKKAYQEINVAMQANIAQKVLDEKIEEINRDELDNKISKMNKVRDVLTKMLPAGQVNILTQRIDEVTKKYVDAGKSAEYIAESLDYGLKNTFLKGAYVPDKLKSNIESYANVVIKEASRVKKVKDELAAFVPGVGQKNEIPEVVITGTAPKKDAGGSGTETDKDKFAKAEETYYRKIADIKKQYLADDKMTQEAYNQQMQDAEMQLLNDKLEVAGHEPKERQQIVDQILNAQIKMRDELRKIDEQNAKDAKKQREKSAEETFTRLDKEYQLQVEATTMFHYRNNTSEKEYYDKLCQLQEDYYEKILDDVNVSEERKNEIREKMRERDLKKTKDKSEKEKEIERKKYDILEDAAKDFGNMMADFFTDSETSLADFLRETIKLALDTLQKFLILKVAERTIDNIGTLGVWGLAKAAGEIALITAAFETAKGALGNFYTGGYTSSGDWDQPQGIVHSNEFVANRYAVANPAIRPVLDLIDSAQRTGSIANLTNEDIAAVVPRSATVSSSVPPATSSKSVQISDPILLATLNECSHAIRLLKIRLDEPFITENYVTGRHGIDQALNLYNKLKSNVSRL